MKIEGPIPIDIYAIVNQIKAGDVNAEMKFDNAIRPRLTGFFRRRTENLDPDDLAQDTLIYVSKRVHRFDPKRGRGSPEQNLFAWMYRIARSTLNQALRNHLSDRAVPFNERLTPSNPEPEKKEVPNFSELLKNRLAALLRPTHFDAVDLYLSGKNLAEIAQALQTSIPGIKNRLYRARKVVEDRCLYPAGFKSVASYRDQSISTAAKRGSLTATKFLDKTYTTDEWVRQYHPRLKRPSRILTHDRGLLSLSEVATPSEYSTLRGSCYEALVIRYGGRLYISPIDLAEFRSRRQKPVNNRPLPPNGYVPIDSLVTTRSQARSLRNAAMKERVGAVKIGAWWFIEEKGAMEFLNSTGETPPISHRPIEDTPLFPKKNPIS